MDLNSRVELNNGVSMPLLGLGVFRAHGGEEARSAVRTALENGYRMIDTARIYCNERSVGRGVRDSMVAREDIFIITKLWKDDFDNPRRGLEQSLERLGMDYVDQFLLHWPFKGFEKAWLELEKLCSEGLCRSIGVSNFKIHHLEELKEAGASVVPQVNQVECHPYNHETELINWCRRRNIVVQAYAPLGGVGNTVLSDPRITTIADYYKVTPAQLVLRWNMQRGVAVIPKSVRAERILENSRVFGFELSQDDMDVMSDINSNLRRAYDPDKIDQRPAGTFPKIIEED